MLWPAGRLGKCADQPPLFSHIYPLGDTERIRDEPSLTVIERGDEASHIEVEIYEVRYAVQCGQVDQSRAGCLPGGGRHQGRGGGLPDVV